MVTLADPLPDDLQTAHQLIRELLEAPSGRIHLNEKHQHRLEQLLRRRYGRKAERIDPAQLLPFAREIPAQAEPAPPPESTPEPAPAPTPPRAPEGEGHGRKPLPASPPREPARHDVPPEQRACPDCGAERTCIGQEVREQLEYVPASLVVPEHIRPKPPAGVAPGRRCRTGRTRLAACSSSPPVSAGRGRAPRLRPARPAFVSASGDRGTPPCAEPRGGINTPPRT